MAEGVAIIDKPAGWTSHDVVARVRRLFDERRVGHTGTLDPFATGVLVVLLGRATRLAQFLSGAEKEYVATIRFGYATETGDLTGARRGATATDEGDAVSASKMDEMDAICASLSEERIEAALSGLRGEIEQVPPMYSAKKVKGRKLYELARRGEEIERAAVRVRVGAFELLRHEGGEFLRRGADGTCELRARIVCSAGTYVRVLAESLGERVGVGAHLSALRRTRAGEFRIEEALTLEELSEQAKAGELSASLLSPDAALSALPFVHLTGDEARRVGHGAAVSAHPSRVGEAWTEGQMVRLRDEEGRLLAVAVFDSATGQLKPRVTLAPE
ncbi:MAG TPA: tRNA pseudouridine(55) synthase TruB [Pyrinomonadaceae bacterium]|jgi:tRNA pseudouridine55 synthase